jgi:hypothetical protein
LFRHVDLQEWQLLECKAQVQGAHEAATMTTGNARRWSQEVTRHSDALDLEKGVFAQPDPKRIARSLKQSAEHSARRKSTAFRSAMSMLNFYINRAGSKLPAVQRRRLEAAKDELRRLYGRPSSKSR